MENNSHTKKKLSENGVTFLFMFWSCLDQFPVFPQWIKSKRKLNISLNKNIWKKYNLRQSRLCFKISELVPE